MDINQLCDRVRETAYAVHVFHGPGHMERVYENVLVHRLRKAGLLVEQQFPLIVFDEDGTDVGQYFADLVVERCLLVELKAARKICPEHIAQIVGYLKSSRMQYGLLLNFGAHTIEIKRFSGFRK